MKICVFLALVVFGLTEGKDVPSIFQKCKVTDDNLTKCLTETANKGWPQLVKGDDYWGAIHLEPIEDEIINIIKGRIENSTISGLEDVHFTEIKANLKEKSFNIIFTCPRISLTGNVDVEGNFLGLSITNNGMFNATFYGGVYSFRFKYELKEKDGQQYIQIKEHAVVYSIDKLNIELYGSDKTRNARANKLFNNNWKLLNALSSPNLNKVFSVGFATHVDKFFEDIPFNNLFD